MLDKSNDGKAAFLLSQIPDYFEYVGEALTHKRMYADAVRWPLLDCFPKPADLDFADYQEAFREALIDYVKDGCNGLVDFRERLKKALSVYRKRNPIANYSMGVRVNFSPTRPLNLKLWGIRARFTTSMPRSMKLYINKQNKSSVPPDHLNGGTLTVSGSFRSYTAAGYSLARDLDLIIATLNFLVGKVHQFISPLAWRAQFLTGPRYTLYSSQDIVPDSMFWINETFSESLWKQNRQNLQQHVERIKLTQNRWSLRYDNTFGDIITNSILIINKSFHSKTESQRSLLIWSCLETLLADAQRPSTTNSKVIASRASRFSADRNLVNLVLISLAGHRNDEAHSKTDNSRNDSIEGVNDYATSIVIHVIKWLVDNGSKFSNRDSFTRCLDLPEDLDDIKDLELLIKLNRRFWHPPAQ